jgi:hypothetical protein
LLGGAFGEFFFIDAGSYDVGFDDVDGFDFSSVITEIVEKNLN